MSLDCLNGSYLEHCYEVLNGNHCFHLHFSFDVKNCRDSSFLFDCEGCQNCYGCYGLINKKYCILNIQYSAEEYESKLLELQKIPIARQKLSVQKFLMDKKYSIRLPKNIGSEGIVDSYQVHNSKSIHYAVDIRNSEDIRYCQGLLDTRLALDVDIWGDCMDQVYESHQVGESLSSVYFSVCCWANVSDLYYSAYCVDNVHHCFGCIGLRNASYCILNKQYTKEEYEILVPQIIEKMIIDGEWGEFFPAKYSHFGYNQTMNMDKYPLTKEEALRQGFYWSDYEAPFPKVDKTIPAEKLPDDISKIPDDVLHWAIECEVTKKPFRITKHELEFYRKHVLPIPHKHPDERYSERTKIYINY